MNADLAFLTALGSIAAFLFGTWKYLDTRKIELKNRRFEQYRLISMCAAGRTENGQLLTEVHQAVAIYQMSEFPEFAYMSLPVIEYFLERTKNQPASAFIQQALTETRDRLKK